MANLCLVYGSFDPVKQFIGALDSDTYYTIVESTDKRLNNDDNFIIIPSLIDPMDVPEFVMSFNDRLQSKLIKCAWIVQGIEDKLKQFERFNPAVIVRETSDGTFVHIGSEVRLMNIKPNVELYVKPKSSSTRRIIQLITPLMETIKEQYNFTLKPVTDDNTANVPSSIDETPALVTPDGIVYKSDAIIGYLKGIKNS
jgi:hypothetical protein